MRSHHGVALACGEAFVVQAEYVGFHASGDQRDQRVHVLGDTRRGVQGNGRPDPFDIALVDTVLLQEVAGGVGAIDLEAAAVAAVGVGQAHVVEHAAAVQQLCVIFQAQAPAGEGGEIIDAAGVVEQQRRSGVADQLGDLAGHGGVGDVDAGD
ncbi:hypothetical protein WR25_09954 [Diploscapter pachys]|uniref:Uncharacterized protein n=1 Tax=Diploscapter pachys TaxID=2018661 RepID=A0A2A2M2N3_9BILA|nr:hypothetical protein WR25_09954 [Diploscapter pachys]